MTKQDFYQETEKALDKTQKAHVRGIFWAIISIFF